MCFADTVLFAGLGDVVTAHAKTMLVRPFVTAILRSRIGSMILACHNDRYGNVLQPERIGLVMGEA